MSTANTETVTVETREIILSYNDIVNLFSTNGITVVDPAQQFTIVVRRVLANGNRDLVAGQIVSGESLILEYNAVTS